jgi:hypothetical protein
VSRLGFTVLDNFCQILLASKKLNKFIIINSREQIPLEVDNRSACQEIPEAFYATQMFFAVLLRD